MGQAGFELFDRKLLFVGEDYACEAKSGRLGNRQQVLSEWCGAGNELERVAGDSIEAIDLAGAQSAGQGRGGGWLLDNYYDGGRGWLIGWADAVARAGPGCTGG